MTENLGRCLGVVSVPTLKPRRCQLRAKQGGMCMHHFKKFNKASVKKVDAVENAAKHVFDAMREATITNGKHDVPKWVEHGNSQMQEIARYTARRILSLINKEG